MEVSTSGMGNTALIMNRHTAIVIADLGTWVAVVIGAWKHNMETSDDKTLTLLQARLPVVSLW